MMRVRSAGGCSTTPATTKTGPIRSRGALFMLSLLASSSLAATARATEVLFPQDHPKIKMEVPDDWAVTYSALGVEIVSPEKNLAIVANLVPRKKPEADAWAIKAEKRLEAFGVTFETESKMPPAAASPPKPETEAKTGAAVTLPDATTSPAPSPPPVAATTATPAKTEATAAVPPTSAQSASAQSTPAQSVPAAPVSNAPAASTAPEIQGTSAPVQVTPKAKVDREAPTFTFMNPPIKIEPPEAIPAPPAAAYFGPPSLGMPTKPIAPTAVQDDARAGATLEELTRPPVIKPKIPFGGGHLPSATFDGKPIDVEIINFSVSQSQLFLVLQASGPSDNRAVAIMQSVKPAT